MLHLSVITCKGRALSIKGLDFPGEQILFSLLFVSGLPDRPCHGIDDLEALAQQYIARIIG
jgi:hypothetical protein